MIKIYNIFTSQLKTKKLWKGCSEATNNSARW